MIQNFWLGVFCHTQSHYCECVLLILRVVWVCCCPNKQGALSVVSVKVTYIWLLTPNLTEVRSLCVMPLKYHIETFYKEYNTFSAISFVILGKCALIKNIDSMSWGDVSVIKRRYCSCRSPGFGSYNPHNGLQSNYLTPDPENPLPALASVNILHMWCTYMQTVKALIQI